MIGSRDSVLLPRVSKAIRTPAGDRVYFAVDSGLVGVRGRDLQIVPSIKLPRKPRAVVTSPSGDRIYVAADSSNELLVVDRYTGSISTRVALPSPALALRMDPTGRYVLARASAGDTAYVISVSTDRMIGAVPTVWRPDLPAVAPNGWLALVRGKDVVLVDAETLATKRAVVGGAADDWMFITWNGFRPRAASLDQPVTFESNDSVQRDTSENPFSGATPHAGDTLEADSTAQKPKPAAAATPGATPAAAPHAAADSAAPEAVRVHGAICGVARTGCGERYSARGTRDWSNATPGGHDARRGDYLSRRDRAISNARRGGASRAHVRQVVLGLRRSALMSTPHGPILSMWEAEGNRHASAFDACAGAVVIGERPSVAAEVALGIARVQARRRRVAVADTVGELGPLEDLVPMDAPYGLVDSFFYGVSLNKIAYTVDPARNLIIFPSGAVPIDHEALLGSDRWVEAARSLSRGRRPAAHRRARRIERAIRVDPGDGRRRARGECGGGAGHARARARAAAGHSRASDATVDIIRRASADAVQAELPRRARHGRERG